MIINLIIFVAALTFVFFTEERRRKTEIERLREVIRAVKSKDVKEYEEVLPPLEEIPIEEKDEIVPLEEATTEEIIRADRE